MMFTCSEGPSSCITVESQSCQHAGLTLAKDPFLIHAKTSPVCFANFGADSMHPLSSTEVKDKQLKMSKNVCALSALGLLPLLKLVELHL